MHPSIFSFGPIAVRSYGLMLAIAFMTGIMFAARRASKAGENPDHIYNMSVWLVLSALFGARLYYVVTHYNEFRVHQDITGITRILKEFRNMFWPIGVDGVVGINGLVLYGGFIGATLTAAFYMYKYRLSIPKYMDIMAPSLGIGIFFTRIGCFLNGCCYGEPTESMFGMMFPPDSAAGHHYHGLHIHPSQLYQSLMGLAIFGTLLYLERHKKFDGFLAVLFFMLYAVARFIADFFRYYEADLTFFGLSHNQLLSIVIFLVAGGLLIFFSARAQQHNNLSKG